MTDIDTSVLLEITYIPENTETGKFIIGTATRSTYLYDADAKTLTRYPDDQRVADWINDGGVPPKIEFLGDQVGDGAMLRADAEPIPVVEQGLINVGRSAIFIIDLGLENGALTNRMTSPVVRISVANQ